VLQSVAECCRVLQSVAECRRVSWIVAICCSVLQCGAVCPTLWLPAWLYSGRMRMCNTLQHTATHCNALQYTATHLLGRVRICNTLQHTATHRNTLQHTATHLHSRTRGVAKVFPAALHVFLYLSLALTAQGCRNLVRKILVGTKIRSSQLKVSLCNIWGKCVQRLCRYIHVNVYTMIVHPFRWTFQMKILKIHLIYIHIYIYTYMYISKSTEIHRGIFCEYAFFP